MLTGRRAQNLGVGWRRGLGGRLSACLWPQGLWAPPWGRSRWVRNHDLPTLQPRGWPCWALPGTESTACEKCLASRSPAEPVGPGDVLTALTHREKLLETKLKTKIFLSMIASQVFILTSLCGSFKLRFWKLLASPRSTTKI